MAGTGKSMTYAELEARSNQVAHLLRRHGLKRGDDRQMLLCRSEHHPARRKRRR
jgi:long-chain acyl-CoA synthetase